MTARAQCIYLVLQVSGKFKSRVDDVGPAEPLDPIGIVATTRGCLPLLSVLLNRQGQTIRLHRGHMGQSTLDSNASRSFSRAEDGGIINKLKQAGRPLPKAIMTDRTCFFWAATNPHDPAEQLGWSARNQLYRAGSGIPRDARAASLSWSLPDTNTAAKSQILGLCSRRIRVLPSRFAGGHRVSRDARAASEHEVTAKGQSSKKPRAQLTLPSARAAAPSNRLLDSADQ